MTPIRTASERERLLVPVDAALAAPTAPPRAWPEAPPAPVPLAPPESLDDADWIGPVFVGTPPPVDLRQPYAPVEVAPRPAAGLATEASTPVRQQEDARDLALDHPVLFQARSALIMVAILSVALVVQLAWVSNWVHRSSQVSLFNRFRTELALGTGPIGATKPALAIGQPMALIEIPSIGVKQVVVEGTTGGALALGPGHLQSTVFPGGVGDSVIMGRAASYGGPFGRLHQLHKGSTITVVTQVGTARFRVLGVREAGGAPYRVSSRAAILTLQTAYGPNYAPSGVVTVTAEATGTALDSQRPPVAVVPPSQRPLGVDTGALSSLLLWLIGLAAVLGAAVWTWHRRGHLQTWIVFGAPLALIWFFVADQVTRILPNLL